MAVGSGWELSHHPAWVGREGGRDMSMRTKTGDKELQCGLCCVVLYVECG